MMARPVPPIPVRASRQPCGPAPQFTPTTSTCIPSSSWAAPNGSVPSGSSTSSPKVSIAMIGRSADASRASSMAIARWSSRENVSNWKRSTPPSSRPSMVSRNAARTAASPEAKDVRRRAAKRPDRPRDQHVPAGDVPCLAGDLGAAPGEASGLVREAVGRQADAVRPERRGLDEIGTGVEVLAVDGADQVRASGDQLVEVRPLRDAAREQQRAHRPVGQDRPGREPFPQARSCVHRGTAYRATRARWSRAAARA